MRRLFELLDKGWIAALCGLLLPVGVSAILVPFRTTFALPAAALVLVLVVVAVGSFGNRLAGLIAALSSAAWFDFFLTKPYDTFNITYRPDLQTAIALLVVGLAVTEIAARSRGHRRRPPRRPTTSRSSTTSPSSSPPGSRPRRSSPGRRPSSCHCSSCAAAVSRPRCRTVIPPASSTSGWSPSVACTGGEPQRAARPGGRAPRFLPGRDLRAFRHDADTRRPRLGRSPPRRRLHRRSGGRGALRPDQERLSRHRSRAVSRAAPAPRLRAAQLRMARLRMARCGRLGCGWLS